MRYTVLIDYKNFIPIDETELEKATGAFLTDGKAFFKRGATAKIQAILPDYHSMMGYNYGYVLQPQDWKEIRNDEQCQKAEQFLEATLEGARNKLLRDGDNFKQLGN